MGKEVKAEAQLEAAVLQWCGVFGYGLSYGSPKGRRETAGGPEIGDRRLDGACSACSDEWRVAGKMWESR